MEELERLRDEEQESFDNLPKSLQASERGLNMEKAVSEMDNALGNIQGGD